MPHLENRAEAEMVVEASRFPPFGDRSLLATNPHTLFRGGPAAETMRSMDEATLVAGMIELVHAVENADDIAAVVGLDMLLVGANDLCNSLGVPGNSTTRAFVTLTATLLKLAGREASISASADSTHGRMSPRT